MSLELLAKSRIRILTAEPNTAPGAPAVTLEQLTA
jgi:hypothetical protein